MSFQKIKRKTEKQNLHIECPLKFLMAHSTVQDRFFFLQVILTIQGKLKGMTLTLPNSSEAVCFLKRVLCVWMLL